MQATLLGQLACAGVFASALLVCCGKDEGTDRPRPVSSASGQAGAEPSASGGELNTLGGAGASDVPGATGGTAPLGAAGEGASSGDGGAGGAPIDEPMGGEQLDICARLISPVKHADDIGRVYSVQTYADCRVKWIFPTKTELDDFRQDLLVWNLELWGCQGKPVTRFALVWNQPPLSAGDANIVIEHYLSVAQTDLDLSETEHAALESTLQRLAQPLVQNDSTEPSQSSCNDGAGGAGGANP